MNTQFDDDDEEEGDEGNNCESDDAKRLYADDVMRRYEDLGWSRNGRDELVDPNDQDVSIWRNPYSHEILLSKKLIEQLKKLHESR